MLRLLKVAGTLAAILGILGVVSGATLLSYTKSGIRDAADKVEDQVPFAWKLDAERDAIERMAVQRQGLKLQVTRTVAVRDVHLKTAQHEESKKLRLAGAARDAQSLLDEMAKSGTCKTPGRGDTRANLEKTLAEVVLDANTADAATRDEGARVTKLNAEIGRLNSAHDEIARAEASRRARFAAMVQDKQILDVRKSAAEARLQARGLLSGENGSAPLAAQRQLDREEVEVAVMEERAGDNGPAPAAAYPLTLDELRDAAAKIATATVK